MSAAEMAAATAMSRLRAFAGWVDPAVSLAGVSPAVLAGLVAAGSVEMWHGQVRAAERSTANAARVNHRDHGGAPE